VRDEHARYFATYTEAAASGLLSADESLWIERTGPETDNVRAALTWAIEAGRTDTALQFFAPNFLFGFSEIARVVVTGAQAALALPGIDEQRRLPIVLATAAMAAASVNDREGLRRHLAAAIEAQERQRAVSPEVHEVRAFEALTSGRIEEYQQLQQDAIAVFREADLGSPLALSLTGAAMAKALRGEDLTLAAAETDEAVRLAEDIAAPTRRMTIFAFSAFVLADMEPERSRAHMNEALRLWELTPGNRNPVHSVLGDVAERLGDERRAVEYFVIGMDQHAWLGNFELVGRMLRRIGLALVERDPGRAAVIIGAGTARSQSSALTERVNRQHRERVAVLEASLGADRTRALMEQGEAMADHEAVAFARAAARDALETMPADLQGDR
jgi:hypothetical protein